MEEGKGAVKMKTQERERVIEETEFPKIPEKYALIVTEWGIYNDLPYVRLAKGYEVDGEPYVKAENQAELEEKLGRIERSREEVYTARELRNEFVLKIGALLKDRVCQESKLIAITLYLLADRIGIDLADDFPAIAVLVD